MNSVRLQATKLTYKSVAFLCANNELSERKVSETISFTITAKIIKYLGINLTKEVKDLYFENYKTLMKEFENDTKKWKDTLCSWIGKINGHTTQSDLQI